MNKYEFNTETDSMTLGDYLRWLASTLEPSHAPIALERAKQADALRDALHDLLYCRTYPSGTLSKSSILRNDKIEAKARAAILKAEGK